ncbi:MAG: cellulase family glycosylhydrolase [Candidatus Stahlbacteria bacterium]|nr:cellulase family glycosylhydrolase [Candidatus Stahlbacteria bacterium]
MKKYILACFVMFCAFNSHAQTDKGSPFGINGAQYIEQKYQVGGIGKWAPLDEVKSLGTKWVRILFPWYALEPDSGKFNWTYADSVVKQCQDRGLHILANIHYTPAWARPSHSWPDSFNYPPEIDGAWYNFIDSLVERYDGDNYKDMPGLDCTNPIKYWGMWNEPNFHEFFAYNDNEGAGDYAKRYFNIILKPGWEAATAADPTCKISAPETYWFKWRDNGTYHWENNWIDTLINNILSTPGMLNDLVFSYHIYHGHRDLGSGYPHTATELLKDIDDSARTYMLNRGISNKEFWVTEVGWTTCQDPSENYTEQDQANYYIEMCKGMLERSDWFKRIFFFELWDAPWENRFDHGILKYPLDTLFQGWHNVEWNRGEILNENRPDYVHSGSWSCNLKRDNVVSGCVKVQSKWIDCPAGQCSAFVFRRTDDIRVGDNDNLPGGAGWQVLMRKKGRPETQSTAVKGDSLKGTTMYPFWLRSDKRGFIVPADTFSYEVSFAVELGYWAKGEAWFDSAVIYSVNNPTINLLENLESDSIGEEGFECVKLRGAPMYETEPPAPLEHKDAFDSLQEFIKSYNLWFNSNTSEWGW